MIIGLTVVAFGTSLPELTVNTFNSVKGLNDAVFGNVIGSNLLILGLTGIILLIKVTKPTVAYEVPLSIILTIVLYASVNDHLLNGDTNVLKRLGSIILLICFAVFVLYILKSLKSTTNDDVSDTKVKPVYLSTLLLSAGLGMMVFGGYLITENAVVVAKYFAMSEKIIALTVLSIGTSLPELATSAVAAYKRKPSIVVGNVIGSNIFNIAFILGLSRLIRPIGFDLILNMDIYILLFGSLLLMIYMYNSEKMKIDRWEAVLMLIIYVLYTIYIFHRN